MHSWSSCVLSMARLHKRWRPLKRRLLGLFESMSFAPVWWGRVMVDLGVAWAQVLSCYDIVLTSFFLQRILTGLHTKTTGRVVLSDLQTFEPPLLCINLIKTWQSHTYYILFLPIYSTYIHLTCCLNLHWSNNVFRFMCWHQGKANRHQAQQDPPEDAWFSRHIGASGGSAPSPSQGPNSASLPTTSSAQSVWNAAVEAKGEAGMGAEQRSCCRCGGRGIGGGLCRIWGSCKLAVARRSHVTWLLKGDTADWSLSDIAGKQANALCHATIFFNLCVSFFCLPIKIWWHPQVGSAQWLRDQAPGQIGFLWARQIWLCGASSASSAAALCLGEVGTCLKQKGQVSCDHFLL